MSTAAAALTIGTRIPEPLFGLSLPIAKVDAEKRIVYGLVTDEVLDRQGDVVDFETAKKFFTDEALWPGNIREMHGSDAVGKRVVTDIDDEGKKIYIGAYVSKGAPQTWEKCLDGTLGFFSIKGRGERVVEKFGDVVGKRLYLQALSEVSLVDSGANQNAKFEIVKSVDGATGAIEWGAATSDDTGAEQVDKAFGAVMGELEKAFQKKDEKKDGKKKKDDEAADEDEDDAEKMIAKPFASVGDVRKALSRLLLVPAGKRFAAFDDVVKRATDGKFVPAPAPAALFVTRKDAVEKALASHADRDNVIKACMEPWDIEQALATFACLERLTSSEYYEAYSAALDGTADSPARAQLALLKSAGDLLMQFIASEWSEQFADAVGAGGTVSLFVDAEKSLDGAVDLFSKSLDVVRKAGARHNRKDQDMVQKIHDTAATLGGVCVKADADAEKVEKAEVVTLKKQLDDVTGLLTEARATLTNSQSIVRKSAETIEGFEKRLATIEDKPAPGGPVRSAQGVDKSLAATSTGEGPAAAADASDPNNVLKAYDTLAAAAPNDAERMDLLSKRVTFQRAHGIGQLDGVTGEPKK